MKKNIKKRKEIVKEVSQLENAGNQTMVIAGLMLSVALIMAYYMINSPRPYDDDNIGRYFMAQAAITKPEYFLNMWGRPLAIVFFLLPSQLGYWYCAGATALLSMGTIFFTYKIAQRRGLANGWLTIIFLFFQPLFLITSFSLCTEPLAAFALAVGLYLYYSKRWKSAALLISFAPLARTELTLLLPVFAVALYREKQYVSLLLLGTGLAILQIAGMLMTQDVLFLLTAAKSAGHGLYANGPFDHYFLRFIFIVGPIVFTFILVQLTVDIQQRRITVINTSCLLLFCVHVYFYWKGNVASIGFLRHFVVISPLLALWGVEGYRSCFSDDARRAVLWTLIGVATVTLMFFSFELVGDYFISSQKEYMKFFIVAMILLFFILFQYLNFRNRFFERIVLSAFVVTAVGYTLLKVPTWQLAPEQQTVKNFHAYFEAELKNKIPMTMIAHPWFFFFDDFNYYAKEYASGNYIEMRKEKMSELPVGGLVVWDTHYSWRLSSNVQQDDLTKNPDYKFIQQFVSTDRKFAIYVFEKIKG